jgi:aerobic carbon-monoxide dehydrogenase small subunit
MTVNGKPVKAQVEARTLLVDFLRDELRLTGTHIGCDTAQCGACTIHMNGAAVKCCNLLAVQAEGADILTIEGIAGKDGAMHPMQAAFRDHHGLQCGFCTPGMVMSAIELVKHQPDPDEHRIRAELDGNLCRQGRAGRRRGDEGLTGEHPCTTSTITKPPASPTPLPGSPPRPTAS